MKNRYKEFAAWRYFWLVFRGVFAVVMLIGLAGAIVALFIPGQSLGLAGWLYVLRVAAVIALLCSLAASAQKTLRDYGMTDGGYKGGKSPFNPL